LSNRKNEGQNEKGLGMPHQTYNAAALINDSVMKRRA